LNLFGISDAVWGGKTKGDGEGKEGGASKHFFFPL